MSGHEIPAPEEVENARQLLMQSDPQGPDAFRFNRVSAANCLMMACVAPGLVGLPEMLRCLDYGGVIAEFGARCLYVRTGRDGLGWRSAGADGLPFVIDRADWEAWLRENRIPDLPPPASP